MLSFTYAHTYTLSHTDGTNNGLQMGCFFLEVTSTSQETEKPVNMDDLLGYEQIY